MSTDLRVRKEAKPIDAPMLRALSLLGLFEALAGERQSAPSLQRFINVNCVRSASLYRVKSMLKDLENEGLVKRMDYKSDGGQVRMAYQITVFGLAALIASEPALPSSVRRAQAVWTDSVLEHLKEAMTAKIMEGR